MLTETKGNQWWKLSQDYDCSVPVPDLYLVLALALTRKSTLVFVTMLYQILLFQHIVHNIRVVDQQRVILLTERDIYQTFHLGKSISPLYPQLVELAVN